MTEDSEQTVSNNDKENKTSITSSSRRSASSGKTTSHSTTHLSKTEKKDRSRDGLQTRVVIRHLPPTMTSDQFLEDISPIPEYHDYYFVRADTSLGIYSFSRAYINFIHMEDVFLFKDKFDNYVFIDLKGNEFPAIVEFAPFQKIPRHRVGSSGQPITAKKRDSKCGTIEQDSDYIAFLEELEKSKQETNMPSAEVFLEEIEARDKELKANHGVLKVTTPLIEYIKNKKAEKLRLREERYEERRKLKDQKRIREEEYQRKVRVMKKEDKDKKHRDSDEHNRDKTHKKDEERVRTKTRDSDRKDSNRSYESNRKSDSKKSEKKSNYSNSRRDRSDRIKDKDKDRDKDNSINNTTEPTFVVKVLQNNERDKPQESEAKSDSTAKKFEKSGENNSSQETRTETSNEQKKSSETKCESYSKNSSESRRIRNKDRPSREIYKPGSVKRSGESSKSQTNADSNASNAQKSSTNRSEHSYKNRVFTRSKHND